MKIGVPTEIKREEYRVGLTPSTAKQYVEHGHQVLVQRGAGLGSSFNDEAYSLCGCQIIDTAQAVYAQAQMIVKEIPPAHKRHSVKISSAQNKKCGFGMVI